MRARRRHPARADLSRLVRQLGPEARAYLDTRGGYPTHRAVTPTVAAALRRQLRQPDPATRAEALAALRRLIIGHDPSPPRWSTPRQP